MNQINHFIAHVSVINQNETLNLSTYLIRFIIVTSCNICKIIQTYLLTIYKDMTLLHYCCITVSSINSCNLCRVLFVYYIPIRLCSIYLFYVIVCVIAKCVHIRKLLIDFRLAVATPKLAYTLLKN